MLAAVVAGLLSGNAGAQDQPLLGPQVENDRILVRLLLHTPDQMAAFYEGRGFPARAVAKIRQSCFITVHIENKSDDVIWLEPANWRILGQRGLIRQQGRDYWRAQWDSLDLPRSKRATFGWTLLPELRDLQPGEPVGGNITLLRTEEFFTIDARFMTGARKRKDQIHVVFENIHCPPG